MASSVPLSRDMLLQAFWGDAHSFTSRDRWTATGSLGWSPSTFLIEYLHCIGRPGSIHWDIEDKDGNDSVSWMKYQYRTIDRVNQTSLGPQWVLRCCPGVPYKDFTAVHAITNSVSGSIGVLCTQCMLPYYACALLVQPYSRQPSTIFRTALPRRIFGRVSRVHRGLTTSLVFQDRANNSVAPHPFGTSVSTRSIAQLHKQSCSSDYKDLERSLNTHVRGFALACIKVRWIP